jgi:Sulfotransferase family
VGSHKPILVTGSHRSGTTWVGRIIASSPSVAYIHEPFHIHNGVAVCQARFDCWFTYVCAENEDQYRKPIAKMLRAARRRSVPWYRTSRIRPLIKDPLAVFSAAWLASRFETRNVVLIRHPAAFAGSLKRNNWTHPFSHFLRQPLLMKHHLQPFADQILSFACEERDIVDQAALLWNVIHSMILRYQETFPDWIYVRHEDLSRNPMEGFRFVFDRLELELCAASRQAIVAHSFAQAPTDLKRNSLANIDTWKRRLTGAEIERLKSQVWDISRRFYSDQEW